MHVTFKSIYQSTLLLLLENSLDVETINLNAEIDNHFDVTIKLKSNQSFRVNKEVAVLYDLVTGNELMFKRSAFKEVIVH